MRRSRTDKSGRLRRRARTGGRARRDAVSVRGVDWDTPVMVDVDPKLAEAIRSRGRLRQITLRVGLEQVAEASSLMNHDGMS